MSAKVGQKVAVVGAGASACFFSYLLRDTDHEISIFEKSRGIGGRCSVRRTEEFGSFNLGAQFFTNKNPKLRDYFEEIKARGMIKELPGDVGYLKQKSEWQAANKQQRFVGIPSMNSFLKYWAAEAEIKLNMRIKSISKTDNKWCIETEKGEVYEGFDTCVLSVPHPQGLAFWQDHSDIKVPETKMFPCLALILATDEISLPWPNAFLKDSMLSWYGSKNRLDQVRTWTVHASPIWSEAHFDADSEWTQEQMINELFSLLKVNPKVHFSQMHRWRYASSQSSADHNFLWDSHNRLAYIGDWLAGGRVEGAMESAASLATILSQDA